MYYSFEDLYVWQEGMELVAEVYTVLNTCRDYALLNQIHRSAISVPSNIAEGYERKSNKEFIWFLYIARGSCGELRTQIHLAISLNYINKETGQELINKTKKVSSMIYNLIKKREEK